MNAKRTKGIIGVTVLGLAALSIPGAALVAGIMDPRTHWWTGLAVMAGIVAPFYVFIKALKWRDEWRGDQTPNPKGFPEN